MALCSSLKNLQLKIDFPQNQKLVSKSLRFSFRQEVEYLQVLSRHLVQLHCVHLSFHPNPCQAMMVPELHLLVRVRVSYP